MRRKDSATAGTALAEGRPPAPPPAPAVISAYIIKKMEEGLFKKVLLVATGALMSPLSLGQGESIPSIAHAIAIENEV